MAATSVGTTITVVTSGSRSPIDSVTYSHSREGQNGEPARQVLRERAASLPCSAIGSTAASETPVTAPRSSPIPAPIPTKSTSPKRENDSPPSTDVKSDNAPIMMK